MLLFKENIKRKKVKKYKKHCGKVVGKKPTFNILILALYFFSIFV